MTKRVILHGVPDNQAAELKHDVDHGNLLYFGSPLDGAEGIEWAEITFEDEDEDG